MSGPIEKSTDEVQKILEHMKPNQLDTFYKENREHITDAKKAFYYYIKDTLEAKNIFLKDMYLYAGISEKYGEKIVRMEKHTKQRDVILRLCVAGHFSLTETNKALKLYGMNPLYAKVARDACLIVAINNRIYDVSEIDELLKEQGFETLYKEKNM